MTARGQAVWRWPLWSWKHFGLTCVVFAALLVGIGRLQASRADSAAPIPSPTRIDSSGSAPGQLTPSASSTASETPNPSATTPSRPQSSAGPAEVSSKFVVSWARPYDTASEWRRRLLPLSTKEFGVELSKTDPLRVPATAVVGEGSEVARAANAVTMRYTTDNGRVLVSLERTGSGWLVNGIAREEIAGDVP